MKTKKQVSESNFQKQVEIESAHLQHYNHLNKQEADKVALENIKKALRSRITYPDKYVRIELA